MLRSSIGGAVLVVAVITVATAWTRHGAHAAIALTSGVPASCALLLAALRPRWRYSVRAAIVVAAMYVAFAGNLAVSGYAPGPISVGMWCALAAGLLFGARGMFAVGALVVGSILLVGALQPYYDIAVVAADFSPTRSFDWARVSLMTGVVIVAMSVALRSAVSTLERSLFDQERALRATADAFAAEARSREERLEAERALQDAQKIGTIGRLAAGLAHELNNALTVVQLSVARLQRARSDAKATSESVEDAASAWRRASAFTKQLLAFSRQELGVIDLVDASRVVRDSERNLASALPEDSTLRLDASCAAPIMADVARLRQALVNLVVYAHDAIAPGGEVLVRVGIERGVEPRVRMEESLPAGDYATISVEGRRESSTGEQAGEGEIDLEDEQLSLFTTLGIVRNANGTIRARTLGDHGVELIVYWPLEAVEEPAQAGRGARGAADASTARARTERPDAAQPSLAPLAGAAGFAARDALEAWRRATLSRVARVLLPMYCIPLVVIAFAFPLALPRAAVVFGGCIVLLGAPLVWPTMSRAAYGGAVIGGTVGAAGLLPAASGVPPVAFAVISLGVALAAALWGWRGFVLSSLIPVGSLIVAAARLIPAHEKPIAFIFEPSNLAVWVRVAVMMLLTLLVLSALVVRTVAALEESATDRQRMLDALERQREASRAEQAAHVKAVRALAAADREETVGRLAGSVAHDVNNALTVIGAWLPTLGKPDVSVVRRNEGLDAIDHSVAQAVAVIRQLSFDSAQLPMRAHSCELSSTVQRVARSIERVLPQSISLEVEAPAEVTVVVDPMAIRQSLLNLALNARDAMPDGGALTLRVLADEDGQRAVVEVIDTGVGMSEEVAARAFDPFFTTKPAGSGTGLGLASVKQLVKATGGDVALASTRGVGTTIRLSWPAIGAAPSADVADVDGIYADVAGVRVLLAEDEELVRGGMETVLREAGCEVRTACDGDEAARLLAEWKGELDLLCVDGVMPGRPTADVIASCRQRFPDAAVVICSGHVPEELARRALPTGAVELLLKPFSSNDLLVTVSDALVRAGRIRSRAG